MSSVPYFNGSYELLLCPRGTFSSSLDNSFFLLPLSLYYLDYLKKLSCSLWVYNKYKLSELLRELFYNLRRRLSLLHSFVKMSHRLSGLPYIRNYLMHLKFPLPYRLWLPTPESVQDLLYSPLLCPFSRNYLKSLSRFIHNLFSQLLSSVVLSFTNGPTKFSHLWIFWKVHSIIFNIFPFLLYL